MAASRTNASNIDNRTRSRFIVGLMGLILALVLVLAWQAQRATKAHSETAMAVLQDYANLAADEYARQAMAAVGYYGYYGIMNNLRGIADEDPGSLIADGTQENAAAALYVFSIRLPDQELALPPQIELTAMARAFLLHEATSFVTDEVPDTGSRIEHVVLDGEQHTFVLSWTEDASLLFGIEVSRKWLGDVLRQTFDENVLLPESLAGGAVTNDFLYVQMLDGNGGSLLEIGEDNYELTRVSKTLHDEYGGVFSGHTLVAAIDPALAESLIIGGLPKSRLPLIVAFILLATGLLVAAIRQLHRENALMQMRTDFVAEVSHELRTPLTQIRMFTESLMFERLEDKDDKHRALSIINRETQRLIHMVENILRFSGAGRSHDEISLQAQDLEPLIRSVVREFQVIADGKETQFESSLEAGVIAEVDTDAMRQILLNLLDNAVKYGPHGQTVSIKLEQENNRASISIGDEGPGIPTSEREQIWAGYYRLDRERVSAIAGTGIGLAVVGELVRRHGGTVRVVDGDQSGATFVVELPL